MRSDPRRWTAAIPAARCGLLSALALTGCASQPPLPDADVRARFGQVQVVAVATARPGDVVKSGRPEATSEVKVPVEAAGGIAVAAYATVAPYPPIGGALLLGGLIVASAIDIHESIPRDVVAGLDATLAKALVDPAADERLARAIEQAASERPDARAHGLARQLPAADSRLEVQVVASGFRGVGRHPALRFYLVARTRVLAIGGTVLHEDDFMHLGAPRPWADWSADAGAPIRTAVDSALAEIAERVLDELLVTTRFPFDAGARVLPGQPGYGSCWLMPIDPPLEIGWPRFTLGLSQSALERAGRDVVRSVPVRSLTPTLRWEAFPRPRDRVPKNAALIARIDQVVYDLKVWDAEGGHRRGLAYERRGLLAPEHQLEQPLAPDHDYFWSFRARYALDGEPQGTRWASSLVPVPPTADDARGPYCEREMIPSANHYRFTTRRPP